MASKFESWLSEKLLSLNSDVDLDVFVSYITGILETESSTEDKQDSLVDIIGEILPNDTITEHCSVIVDKWNELSICEDAERQAAACVNTSIVHSIIEQQTAVVPTCKQVPVGDASHKKAILAQYAEVSDSEESDVVQSDTATAAANSDLLVKNMNALKVKEREKTERDRAKQESESKRQKDKEDREKQKQKLQDRKDNEKKRTQKTEKKR